MYEGGKHHHKQIQTCTVHQPTGKEKPFLSAMQLHFPTVLNPKLLFFKKGIWVSISFSQYQRISLDRVYFWLFLQISASVPPCSQTCCTGHISKRLGKKDHFGGSVQMNK